MIDSKVWYVTGASQGLGLTLIRKLLEKGYRVAAGTRNAEKLREGVGDTKAEQFLPLVIDLTSTKSISESVNQTIVAFGRIDVVVNNAGYGMAGTAEEIDAQDIRKIFDINVLAPINVVKSVLSQMRKQGNGYIINIGSVAGFIGAPGWSVYSATKAALAAFSEVLSLELKEFGIRVTIVEPSNFRTGFLTKNSLAYTESKIDGYTLVKETMVRYLSTDGKQAGNPERASEILIELTEKQEPPIHLYLGQDAYSRVFRKLQAMTSELEEWKSVIMSADFA